MKIIAIIPARYASTRFPGKPLLKIYEKTMINHVYNQVSKVFDTIYVATDDDRIKNEVKRFGGNVILTSKYHKSGTDRCAEAIIKIQRMLAKNFDVVINIQGDEPFIKIEQLNSIISSFENPSTQIATLAKRIENSEEIFNPNSVKIIFSEQKEAIYFSRSPIPYIRDNSKEFWNVKHDFYKHIGLYGYKTSVLEKISKLKQTPLELAESLEQLRWIENGFKIKVEITKHESISIDTENDLKLLLQHRR